MKEGLAERLTQLVQGVMDGERDAFGPEMYRVLMHIGMPLLRRWIARQDIREDLLQESIFRLWRALDKDKGTFKGPVGNGQAYFLTIVKRAIIGHFKRRCPGALSLDDLDRDASNEASDELPLPSDRVIDLERLERIREWKEHLSEEDRMLVALRFELGLSLRAIAQLLGIAVRQVQNRLGKLFDDFHRFWDDQGNDQLPNT